MKKARLSLFLVLLFFAIAPAAHTSSLEKEILGKWGNLWQTYEFFKDGTVIFVNKGMEMVGNYKFIDDTRLRIDISSGNTTAVLEGWAGPRIFVVSVARDRLKLTSQIGVGTFIRLKVDSSGKDAITYFKAGLKSHQSGNYDSAMKDYDKAIELAPELSEAYTNRGLMYIHFGKYKQAVKDFDKSIELESKQSVAYRGRAWTYSALKNYQQAIKDWDKAIELEPRHAGSYIQRGYAYTKLGNYQQATNDLNKALKLPLEHADDHYNIACIYSLQNNVDMACQWLKKAIKAGYKNWDHLKQDKDLDNIRTQVCFQALDIR
jgi:tetratricopeptide (TPR) repeat protein